MHRKLLLLLFLLPLISLFCYAQNNSIPEIEPVSHNNRYYAFGTKDAKTLYKKELLNNYAFLNGREYKLYDIALGTSPLFASSFGLEGTIFVEGESFENVMLAYDIYKDKLIYITSSQLFKDCNFIEINSAIVDSFFLKTEVSSELHNIVKKKQFHFIKVNFPKNIGNKMQNGYYEVAEIGEMKVYIQHKAIQISNQGAEAMQAGLYKYNHILNKTLCINGTYYEINKKNKFLKLFPDKRKEINKMIKVFELRFNLLDKEQMVKILQFINSI
jgi:hypothetical protein